MPIFQAATFRHPELGQSTGFAYSRLENPTRQELERTMAILEGGIKGFAFSSGQAANMAVFSLLMMLAVLSRGGFGMGDVKLMTAQTFLCGAYSASYTFFFALVSCAAVMIILILSSQKKRKDVIPLGPFFYIGYVLSLFLGCFHT